MNAETSSRSKHACFRSHFPAIKQIPTLALSLLLLAILFTGLSANEAFAHRLNVFAWEENGNIIVESNFGANRPARNANVTVRPAASSETILSGETDNAGRFAFPVPDNAAAGLVIVVNAGQGHQNSWEIMPLKQSATTHAPAISAANSQKEKSSVKTVTGPTAAEIRQIVREELAASRGPQNAPATDPGLKEIIGGLGWLIGLCGIFLWLRSRKNACEASRNPAENPKKPE